MKINLKIIKIALLSLATFLFLTFTILLYSEFGEKKIINFFFSTSWLIQILILLSLNFKPNILRWLFSFSLLISLSVYFNLSANFLINSWKYQLSVFTSVLMGYWYLRYYSEMKLYLSVISGMLILFNLIFLSFIIYTHKTNELFFDIAKWNTVILTILLGLSIYSKKLPQA
jgi:hypothetical protein